MEKEINYKKYAKKIARRAGLAFGGGIMAIAISGSAAYAEEGGKLFPQDAIWESIETVEKMQEQVIVSIAKEIAEKTKNITSNLSSLNPNTELNEQLLTVEEYEALYPPSYPQELPDRNNCDEMRGTKYRSEKEREFFLENCVVHEIPSVPEKTPNTNPTPKSGQGETLGNFSITGYYCEKVVGYPGYDNGGFCSEGASGLGTISGQTAACGPSWPFGTVFEIPGYGQVTCTDRGGAVHNSHIDIYFDTDQQLYNANFPSSSPVRKIK